MSMPGSPSGGPRASRTVKLVLMGVAGAALLYSCTPGVGAGLGALPYLWLFPNPFFRGPAAISTPSPGSGAATSTSTNTGSSTAPTTTSPTTSKTAPAATQSQRGGFGSTGGSGSSSGAS